MISIRKKKDVDKLASQYRYAGDVSVISDMYTD